MGPSSCRPTTRRRRHTGWVQCVSGGSPCKPIPQIDWDMECHLPGREGSWVSVRGWKVPAGTCVFWQWGKACRLLGPAQLLLISLTNPHFAGTHVRVQAFNKCDNCFPLGKMSKVKRQTEKNTAAESCANAGLVVDASAALNLRSLSCWKKNLLRSLLYLTCVPSFFKWPVSLSVLWRRTSIAEYTLL